MVAIAAYHSHLGGQSLGRHPLVTRFLCGVLRTRPVQCTNVPLWELAVVREGLCNAPFKPTEDVPDEEVYHSEDILPPIFPPLRESERLRGSSGTFRFVPGVCPGHS